MKRRRWMGWTLLLMAILAFAWFVWPRHVNLRAFHAVKMAEVEARSWRHYYAKQWSLLFGDLYQGSREGYGFSPCDSCRIALHAARAAKAFQPSRSRDESRRAIPPLEDYFRTIAHASRGTFDITKAAQTELEWWQLRREDKTWREYGHAIAVATSVLYDIDPLPLEAGCAKRAEMMALRDHKGKSITEADWHAIEQGLRTAWQLTRDAVQASK